MPPINKSNAVMASRTVPKFIHHISGHEAEQLLLTKGFDGSFLVRTSASDRNVYALSYRAVNGIVHIKFQTTEEGFTAKNLPDEYATIEALIKRLQETKTGLDYPLWPSDPAPEGLLPRLFFGRLTSKHAEKLLLDPDAQHDRNFIIRSSTTYTDQIVLTVRLESGEVVHVLTHRQGDKILTKGKGNERSFDNVKELMDYYMDRTKDPMELDDGRIVKLSKPMVCPWNKDPSSEPSSRKKEGSASTSKSSSSSSIAKHIADEFETLQSEGCSAKTLRSDEVGRRKENIPKNRYKNILPFDATRVVLDPPQDYINANYLKTDERLGRYIGCQGPLPHTTPDLWRMIWQEKCLFIVMLTSTVEAGKNKCHQYWPKDVGKEQTYDIFTIIHQEKVLKKTDYIISKLRLIKGNEEMPVYHCHYVGWPDKSVPKDIGSLVKFSEEILRLRNQLVDRKPGPIVAHCSAGIGRTGTYILISMIIDHIQKFGAAPNILSFSKLLREQRPGMVQTLQQYDLVHKATELYQSRATSETPSAQYGNTGTAAGNVVYGNIN